MKTGRWAGAVREGGGKNFDAVRREENAHLLDAGRVGAVAMAAEERLGIEPDDVTGFGAAGRGDGAERGDLEGLAKRSVARAFGDAVRLAGTHHDQTIIGGKGGIMSVDGVEGEI